MFLRLFRKFRGLKAAVFELQFFASNITSSGSTSLFLADCILIRWCRTVLIRFWGFSAVFAQKLRRKALRNFQDPRSLLSADCRFDRLSPRIYFQLCVPTLDSNRPWCSLLDRTSTASYCTGATSSTVETSLFEWIDSLSCRHTSKLNLWPATQFSAHPVHFQAAERLAQRRAGAARPQAVACLAHL